MPINIGPPIYAYKYRPTYISTDAGENITSHHLRCGGGVIKITENLNKPYETAKCDGLARDKQ